MVVKPGGEGLIPFAQDEALKNEVEKLRVELSMLVLERDELVHVECRNLEMRYLLVFGELEYSVFHLECLILREKRRGALIQAKKNRQEKVDLALIDSQLDNELADWQQRLNQRIERMKQAYEWKAARVMTDEETREMKKLYRAVVKALHPDLNPEAGEEELRLFQHAVSAYERGDLGEMRLIFEAVKGRLPLDSLSGGKEALNDEKLRLTRLIEEARKDMERIRQRFPYTEKELLNSPEKVETRREALARRIQELEQVLDAWNKKTLEIMR